MLRLDNNKYIKNIYDKSRELYEYKETEYNLAYQEEGEYEEVNPNRWK